jgi:predicted dehydrogenase/nucleoside-diphosphate-sugar epimerase
MIGRHNDLEQRTGQHNTATREERPINGISSPTADALPRPRDQATTLPGKMRAGIVGAGMICESHLKALARIDDVEIVGIADINSARAREMAARFAAGQVFSSLAGLLEAKPDVVHVLTPPHAHAENAIEALRAGCHVFVEKPLATSVEDCDRIAVEAQLANREVCVGHSLLRDPFVVRARDIVRSGAIGTVVGVDHFRSQAYPRYEGGALPYQYRDGGFPFRDLGVHSLYLLQAFLGPINDAVLRLGPPSRDGCPLYKDWRVLVPCARGSGHIYFSWEATPPQDLLVIHGTRGVIRADMMGMSVTVRKKGRLPGAAERILNTAGEGRAMITQVAGSVWRILRKKLRRYHGLQDLVAEFYAALRAGQSAPVGVAEARTVVHWTEQIARQADRAKEQYVAEFPDRGTATTLITGATGFIGKHLVRRLIEEKGRIRILARHAPDKEIMEDERVEVFLGNLGNPQDVDRAVAGISELYHLGAAVEGWREDFQCATLAGTTNVVDSALRHGVKRLIYMSSLSVIHFAAANGEKIAEDWPLEPRAAARGLYSQTKLAAEGIVRDAVLQSGLRAIILRPGEVVGPDRPFLSGAVALETSKRLVVLGNGRHTLPLVWVDDLVDAVIAAGKSDQFDGSVLHLVDPAQISQDEIAQLYLRTTGREKKVVHAPYWLLWTAAAGASALFDLLGRTAPLTPYRLKSAVGSRNFECTKAANVLGWEPRLGVRAGLERMATSECAETSGCA